MAHLPRLLALSGMLVLSFGDMSARAHPAPLDTGMFPYVDLHVDLPYQHVFKRADIASGTGQFAVVAAREASLAAVVFPLFVPARVARGGPRAEDYEASWKTFEQGLRERKEYAPPGAEPARGQVRTFYSFEGMGCFTDDREVLARWIKRGVRLFGLVHNQSNALAAAALDQRAADYGLTELGKRTVTQIYALGGVVDVSHASVHTTRAVLDIAEKLGKPVVASHSNARRLLDNPRNLDDQLIDRIARSGGVVGVNFHSPFLAKRRRATIEDVLGQVRYLISRVGADHVAIGSDFEGDIRPPSGLESLAEVQHLAQALLLAKISADDVRAIMGGNALRILLPAARDVSVQ